MDYLDNPPTALEVGHYWAPILCRMWVNFRRRLTLSDCRDLLFHVQEHRFTIPGLAAALNELGLEFLGFVGDRPGRAYGGRFPEDPGMRSLANWHVLETEQPDTFVGMYQFWCVRG